MSDEIILIYIGDGSRVVPGVPLRDLAQQDLSGLKIHELVKSGLYKKPTNKKDGK